MTPTQIALLDFLYEALITIRKVARDGDSSTCELVSDGVHNVPHEIGTPDTHAVTRLIEVDLLPLTDEVPELRMAVSRVQAAWDREYPQQ